MTRMTALALWIAWLFSFVALPSAACPCAACVAARRERKAPPRGITGPLYPERRCRVDEEVFCMLSEKEARAFVSNQMRIAGFDLGAPVWRWRDHARCQVVFSQVRLDATGRSVGGSLYPRRGRRMFTRAS